MSYGNRRRERDVDRYIVREGEREKKNPRKIRE